MKLDFLYIIIQSWLCRQFKSLHTQGKLMTSPTLAAIPPRQAFSAAQSEARLLHVPRMALIYACIATKALWQPEIADLQPARSATIVAKSALRSAHAFIQT
jgi:hypothetical protein